MFVVCAGILIFLGISLFTAPEHSTSAQFNLTVTDGQVLILHTGGESLPCDKLTLLVNGKAMSFPSGSSVECPWSIGEILGLPSSPSGISQNIQILYDSGNGVSELLYAEIPAEESGSEAPASLSPSVTKNIPASTPPLTPSPVPISTPGVPSASFSATPRSGPVPLSVQFTDFSTGVPEEWFWSFGDGTGSAEENPVHVFVTVGSYQISLNVKNAYGAHTRIVQGYVNVTSASGRDVFIEAERGGSVVPGGFLEWTVRSPVAWMKIGGRVHNLGPGDRVRLVVEGNGKGKISVRKGAILEFSFEEVSFYRDGQRIAKGSVREISVPETEHLVSSLSLVIPPGPGTVRILEDGASKPFAEDGSAVVADSLRPGPDGMMILDCFRQEYTQFQGTINPLPI